MTTCPLCRLGAAFSFHKNGYDIFRCDRCRLAFVHPLPQPEAIVDHYDARYFDGVEGRFGYLDYAAEKTNRVASFQKARARIGAVFPQGGRLLDVGCADGSFLEMFGAEWHTEGVELSGDMVSRMPPALQGRVFCGFFEDFPAADGVYDVVTLWDVLDHARDAAGLLRRAAGLLKPNGLLGLVTGDMESAFARLMGRRWYLYIPPVHLTYFSRHALEKSLSEAGLVVESLSYEPKWVSIRLCFFRLGYVLPGALARRLAGRLSRITPEGWRMPINFFDVMTVWARKKA